MRRRREVARLCECSGGPCRFCQLELPARALTPTAAAGRSDVAFIAFEGDDVEPLGNPGARDMFRDRG
jgi:hypothetical protein